MSPASKAKLKAIAKYDAKAYDSLRIRVHKGKKDVIQAAAESAGESLNGYVIKAVDERMGREKQESAE